MRAGIGLHYLDLAHYQGAGGEFSPSSLFGDTDTGGFYDPSDLTSMYVGTDGSGGNPSVGDTVGVILDKSQMGGVTASAFIESQTELVTNGTFDTDATGWTAINSAALSSVNGQLVVENGATSFGRADQEVTITNGSTYVVSFDIIGGTSSNLNFRGGTSAAGIQYFSATGVGSYSFIFTATNTTLYLATFSSNVLGETIIIDNVSVKEIPGNHLTAPSDAARPILRADGELYYLEFDGTDDELEQGSNLSLSATSSVGTVFQPVDTEGSWIQHSGQNTNYYAGVIENTASTTIFQNGAATPVTPDGYRFDGSSEVITDRSDLNDLYKPGGVGTVRVAFYDNIDLSAFTRFGISNYASGFYFDGRWYGTTVIDRVLTTTERQNLEIYLANKSGATLDATSGYTFPGLLYDANTDGGWYDPSDLTSMTVHRSDVAIPASTAISAITNAAVADTVGTIFDLSQLGGLSVQDYFDQADNLIDVNEFDDGGGVGPATATIDGTQVTVADTAAFQSVSAGFATVVGETYMVQGQLTSATNKGWVIKSTSLTQYSVGRVDMVQSADADTDNTFIHSFVADATTSYIHLLNSASSGAGQQSVYDNLKVAHIPGNHLVAPSDAARPVLRDEDVDSPATTRKRYYLEFDGTDDEFVSTILPDGWTGTFFYKAVQLDKTASSSLSGVSDNGFVDRYYLGITTNGYVAGGWDDQGSSTIVDPDSVDMDGVLHVQGLSVSGSTSVSLIKDGTVIDTATTTGSPTTGSEPFHLGATNNSGTSNGYLDGKLYGASLGDRTLTYSEREELEAYLGRKSGTIDFDTAWHPASLFENSEDGAVYDVSDASSLFQGRASATAIHTADSNSIDVGDTVGGIADVSQLGGKTLANYFSDTSAESISVTDSGSPTWTGDLGDGSYLVRRDASANQTYIEFTGLTAGEWYYLQFEMEPDTNEAADKLQTRIPSATNPQWASDTVAGPVKQLVQLASGSTISLRAFSGGHSGIVKNIKLVHCPGNHAVAPSDAARPLLQRDSNNKLYLEFDGTDDSLSNVGSEVSPAITGPMFVGSAAKLPQGSSARIWQIQNSSDYLDARATIYESSDEAFVFVGDNNTASVAAGTQIGIADVSDDVPEVHSFHLETDNFIGWANGSQTLTDTSGDWTVTAGIDQFILGAEYNTAGSVFATWGDPEIYGFVVLDRALTGTERDRLERWLADKAGINLKQ